VRQLILPFVQAASRAWQLLVPAGGRQPPLAAGHVGVAAQKTSCSRLCTACCRRSPAAAALWLQARNMIVQRGEKMGMDFQVRPAVWWEGQVFYQALWLSLG